MGIDLNIIDVREHQDALWLKALIWPEQQERTALLTNAMKVAQMHLPTLLTGERRPIYRISCEWLGTEYPQLTLNRYHRGDQTETLLAHCDFHGRWIEWLAS